MEDKQAQRRAIVYDWVKEVHDHLGWCKEGVDMTMSLIDVQLSRHAELYPPDKYQELAAVMMVIAAKANGDSVSMQKIAEYTADYITTDDLIKAEMTILRRIIDDMTICVLVPNPEGDKNTKRSVG